VRNIKVIKAEEIKLLSPKNNAILAPKENERNAAVRFSWKRIDTKGKFKLQISDDNDFDDIYKESTLEAYSVEISGIEPGKYYWKVSLLEDDGTVLLQSRPMAMIVKDRLAKPRVIYPSDGLKVDMGAKDVLSLNWKNLKDADFYKIELYGIKNKREYSIIKEETKKSNYMITDLSKLDEGRFFWTLQAFDIDKNNNIISKSPEVKTYFIITLGKPMEKPKLDTLKINNLE